MEIEDKRNKKEANIGDIIVTDNGNKYILLMNDGMDSEHPIAVCNIEKDFIKFTTAQKIFVVGGTCYDETIIDIIPKSKIKIIIE